jgi:protein-S-isoprenylcysteine O-methyltransferase Ste14
VHRRLAVAYFVLQGLAVAAWWALLALQPAARRLFLPPGNDASALLAFAPPDLAFLAAGSLLAGILVARQNGWAVPAVWLCAGAVDYSTVHVLAWAALAGGGWTGFVLMAPAALLSTVLALDLAAERLPLYRRARAAGAAWNVTKTLLQIVAFWSFFLALVPFFLVHIEPTLGWSRFAFSGQHTLAATSFFALSALGLLCGWTIARRGDGTPLPLDGPRRLVIAGPYAYVRNPMAIAGLGQGVAVALGLGSWMVLGYVILGGAIWNWVVRPSEEADLEKQFGGEFARYRQAVRCWIPRRRPYRG